jgi:hypothetical protein
MHGGFGPAAVNELEHLRKLALIAYYGNSRGYPLIFKGRVSHANRASPIQGHSRARKVQSLHAHEGNENDAC